MYDAQTLRYFLTAFEVGSFTRAAEALGVTQPSVSAAILKLEARYDGRLFERSRQGLKPTRKGQELYVQLAPVLAQLDRIEGRMLQKAPEVLRIFCQPDILLAPYAAALQALQRARWDLSLQFCDAADQSDIAFVSEECLPPRFRFFPTRRETYGLAVPQQHAFALQEEISPERLTQEPLIGRPYCPNADLFLRNMAEQAGRADQAELEVRERFAPVADAVHDHQVLDLVRAGVGIALVPKDHVAGVTGIKFVRLAGRTPQRQIGVAVRKSAHAHGLAQDLVQALISALPQQPDAS